MKDKSKRNIATKQALALEAFKLDISTHIKTNANRLDEGDSSRVVPDLEIFRGCVIALVDERLDSSPRSTEKFISCVNALVKERIDSCNEFKQHPMSLEEMKDYIDELVKERTNSAEFHPMTKDEMSSCIDNIVKDRTSNELYKEAIINANNDDANDDAVASLPERSFLAKWWYGSK